MSSSTRPPQYEVAALMKSRFILFYKTGSNHSWHIVFVHQADVKLHPHPEARFFAHVNHVDTPIRST